MLALLLPTAVWAEAKSDRPRLVVLELQTAGGVEPAVAQALTEAVTAEAARRGLFQVISSGEIRTLLDQERQRQVMGCASDSGSCLSELAGAVGARFILSGSIAKLGSTYQLSLQTLDSVKAAPIGRSTRIAADLSTLRAQMPYAVAEATATPLPPPPSKILPYSVIGGGCVIALVGGLYTFNQLAAEAGIARELDTSKTNPSVLKPLATYRQERDSLVLGETLGVGAVAVGAAVVGLGIFLNASDGSRLSAVALVPAAHGFALVGHWP